MEERPESEQNRRRPRPEPRVSAPSIVLDPLTEAAKLRGEEAWREHGHIALTLMRRDDLRVVVVSLRGGHRIREHKVAGSFTLEVLEGSLRVVVGGNPVVLQRGQVLALAAGTPHDVEAEADASFLLTISQPA